MEHNISRGDERMPENYVHQQINMQLTISNLIKDIKKIIQDIKK